MKKLQSILSKIKFYLLIILAIGLFLRAYNISNNPPSLNWDEVSHGYNAYSILKTGKDEWGERFPLIFRAYGDYKLPIYIYLSVLPIKIFGLNALGVRFISILAGGGLIMVSYFLGKKLAGGKLGGLTAALLTAVMPWSLFLSRVAVEANLAAFLFSLGWLLFFNSQPLLSALFWGLSVYTYNSARVLVPISGLIMLISLFIKKKYRQAGAIILIFIIFLIPVATQFLNQTGQARFYWVNIIDQGVVNQINQRRGDSDLPFILTKVLYNRPTYFVTTAAKNYLKHFSPNWLFIQGGENYQFSFPNHGLIYLVSAPFLIVGIYFLFKLKKWLWLSWLFISFIPSAITKDSPHVLRSILLLPLPMVFSSLGLIKVKEWVKPRSKLKGWAIVVVFVIINLVSMSVWWRQYWNIYRENYSWAWQYGYQQAVSFVKDNYGHYDQIIFTKHYGEPHEFVLFYWPWEPSYYQEDPTKKWDYHAHWYWVDGFDKFEFWNDWEIEEKLQMLKDSNVQKNRVLLVTSPGNYIEGGELLKTIDFLHDEPAFQIVSYNF